MGVDDKKGTIADLETAGSQIVVSLLDIAFVDVAIGMLPLLMLCHAGRTKKSTEMNCQIKRPGVISA